MSDELKTAAWDKSYDHRDNFVFYPHEEVIRFVARNVRKRTGFDSFQDQRDFAGTPRGLDLGCGIGRHVRFMDDMQLDAYGIDLSPVAIREARAICEAENRGQLADRFHVGSITNMPYEDGFFDFIVSHGVLDSMPFAVAQEAMREARRVLRPGGLVYLDVVCGDDANHYPEFAGEETVTADFEKDTIQSYFNFSRLQSLVSDLFEMRECQLIRHSSMISNSWHSRYHVVLAL
jgi:SAM-dependent methyltransferase